MRLFIAVNFDEAAKSRLLAIQDHLKAQSDRGNFSRPENLHLTLVFIGEVSAALVPEITAIIKSSLMSSGSFSIDLDRMGCFKRGGKELWWIGAESDPQAVTNTDFRALTGIRQQIGDGLDRAGIHYDRRPFRAHITLGREIKPFAPIVLGENRLNVPIRRISLMKSEHLRGMLTYTEIFGQDLP